MKPREDRRKVFVPARMRCGANWFDITIRNMSHRGLMAHAASPPPPRTYVEIRRGTQIVVGRTIWASKNEFGVLSQERLDPLAIVNEPRLASRPATTATDTPSPIERRSGSRRSADADLVRRAERSRRLSSAFQFAILAAAALAAAGFVAAEVYEVLARPFTTIGRHLPGQGS